MPNRFFAKKIMFLSLALFTIPSFICPKTSEKFVRVFDVIQDVVEQNASRISKRTYNPLVLFYQGVSSAIDRFIDIEQAFGNNAFENKTAIHKTFDSLCATISTINATLQSPNDLRPRHIRWLRRDIYTLKKKASLLEKKVANSQDLDLISSIFNFTAILKRSVFPYCFRYVGTTFDHATDFFMQRPWEFLKRNWWWAIPAGIAIGKVGWDSRHYAAHHPPQATNDQNARRDGQSPSSWYKEVTSLVAGGLFSSQFANRFIKMDGHTYVGESIGINYSATNDREHPEINRLGYVVTQIPCLRQSGSDCGYHTLYNAVCLATRNYDLLINRNAFTANLQVWKQFLFRDQARGERIKQAYGFIGADDMDRLIQHFDFFAPIRRAHPQQVNIVQRDNQGNVPAVFNYLQNNISIIFDLQNLEALFQNPDVGALQNILLQGSYNHTLRNIGRFTNVNQDNRHVIIVNEQSSWKRGAHWFLMVIEHDPRDHKDYITLTESQSKDYRRKEIVNRVYNLFSNTRVGNTRVVNTRTRNFNRILGFIGAGS